MKISPAAESYAAPHAPGSEGMFATTVLVASEMTVTLLALTFVRKISPIALS